METNNLNVSICIPTYQMGCYLDKAIQSAINQSFIVSEIIISDNWSTDETSKTLAKYANIPYIRIIKPPYHLPVDDSHAFAVNNCNGDFICILSADDILEPDFLKKVVPLMQMKKKIGFCTTGRLEIDSEGKIIGRSGLTYPKKTLYPPKSLKYFARGCGYTISATIWRKNMLKYWINKREHIGLNIDWFLALTLSADSGVHFLRDALVKYRFHSGSNSRLNRDLWLHDACLMLVHLKSLWSTNPVLMNIRNKMCKRLSRTIYMSYTYSLTQSENEFVKNFCGEFLNNFDKSWLSKYIYKVLYWLKIRLNTIKQIVKKLLFT